MVTTIIAVYGAVVSTISMLLGAWYFLYSGPRFQAEAYVFPAFDEREVPEDGGWFFVLRAWNSGRADITVKIDGIVVHEDDKKVLVPMDKGSWEGPDVPVRIAGHSGKEWWIDGFTPNYLVRDGFALVKFSVAVEVGGKRDVDILVWNLSTENKQPFLLRLSSSGEARVEFGPSSR